MAGARVFISWSGPVSKLVARALRDWLPDVLHAADPFMSDSDIRAGTKWFEVLETERRRSDFVVICATAQNIRSEWLHFEAGAIAMAQRPTGEAASVAPYVIDMKPTDLVLPLSLYEAQEANERGTLRLLEAIDATSPDPIGKQRVARAFEMWWPQLQPGLARAQDAANELVMRDAARIRARRRGGLEEQLEITERPPTPETTERSLEDKVDELLALARQAERTPADVDATSRRGVDSRKERTRREALQARLAGTLGGAWEVSPALRPTAVTVVLVDTEVLGDLWDDAIAKMAAEEGFDEVFRVPRPQQATLGDVPS